MSSTFTEYVIGDKDYSLQEFYVKFSDDLPTVVCVTQGFCSEDNPQETLDQGQILRINSIKRERRVFVRIKTPSKKPYLSIKYDSREIFQFTSFTGEDSQLVKTASRINCRTIFLKYRFDFRYNYVVASPIQELIRRYELPLEIRRRQRKGSRENSSHYDLYQCQRTYDHLYFLANFLSKVRLFVEVHPIPIYIKDIRIAPIIGVKDFENSVWEDFKGKLNTAARSIDFDSHYSEDFIYLDADISVSPALEDMSSGYCGVLARISGGTHQYQNLRHDSITRTSDSGSLLVPRRSMHIYHSIDDLSLLQIDKVPNSSKKKTFSSLKEMFSRKTEKRKSVIISSPLVISEKEPEKRMEFSTTKSKTLPVKPPLPLRSSFRTTHKELETQISSSTEAISRPERDREFHIQEMISEFSINDVGNVLVELGLEHFVESFQKASIDGYTLTMLTKQILHEEFGLKQYEAIKLRNFVRKGHIPK